MPWMLEKEVEDVGRDGWKDEGGREDERTALMALPRAPYIVTEGRGFEPRRACARRFSRPAACVSFCCISLATCCNATGWGANRCPIPTTGLHLFADPRWSKRWSSAGHSGTNYFGR